MMIGVPSIRLRTYLALAALTLGCAIGYFVNHINYNNNITDLYLKNQTENLSLVKSIVALDQQKAESLARDYTYWDEMVDFVANPSNSWAEYNIDTALLGFGVEGIWIFDADGTQIYSIKSEEGQVMRNSDFYLPLESRSKLFQGNRTTSFYLKNSEGEIEEIHGATIHPGNDPERKTDPSGYLLVSRDLNTTYLNSLGAYTNSTVTATDTPQTMEDSELISRGISLNSLPLADLSKNTIGYLNFSTEQSTLKQLNHEVDRQRNLTNLSYLTFYTAIAWLLILYGQGLVVTKKRKAGQDVTTP